MSAATRAMSRIGGQRGDVVDDRGPGVEGLAGRPRPWWCRSRSGSSSSIASASTTGIDPAQLFVERDRLGPRAARFAAQVEHVGPFGDQPLRERDRLVGTVERARRRKSCPASG